MKLLIPPILIACLIYVTMLLIDYMVYKREKFTDRPQPLDEKHIDNVYYLIVSIAWAFAYAIIKNL